MAKLTYKIVEHDGGWAYKVGSTFSETFPSHQDALRAAEIASAEHAGGWSATHRPVSQTTACHWQTSLAGSETGKTGPTMQAPGWTINLSEV